MASFTRRWARHHFRRRAQITVSTFSGINHAATSTRVKAIRYAQGHHKTKASLKPRPRAT